MAFSVCLPSVPALLVALTGRSSSETSNPTDVIDAVADTAVSALRFSSVRSVTLEVALTDVAPFATRTVARLVMLDVALTDESTCVLELSVTAPNAPGVPVAEVAVSCFRTARVKVVTDPVALKAAGVTVTNGVAKAVGVPALPVADTADRVLLER
jgi:hypothetical protein